MFLCVRLFFEISITFGWSLPQLKQVFLCFIEYAFMRNISESYGNEPMCLNSTE